MEAPTKNLEIQRVVRGITSRSIISLVRYLKAGQDRNTYAIAIVFGTWNPHFFKSLGTLARWLATWLGRLRGFRGSHRRWTGRHGWRRGRRLGCRSRRSPRWLARLCAWRKVGRRRRTLGPGREIGRRRGPEWPRRKVGRRRRAQWSRRRHRSPGRRHRGSYRPSVRRPSLRRPSVEPCWTSVARSWSRSRETNVHSRCPIGADHVWSLRAGWPCGRTERCSRTRARLAIVHRRLSISWSTGARRALGPTVTWRTILAEVRVDTKCRAWSGIGHLVAWLARWTRTRRARTIGIRSGGRGLVVQCHPRRIGHLYVFRSGFQGTATLMSNITC